MGSYREVSMEGGGISVHIGKLLLRSGTSGVYILVVDLVDIVFNGKETLISSFGVPISGEEDEGKNE